MRQASPPLLVLTFLYLSSACVPVWLLFGNTRSQTFFPVVVCFWRNSKCFPQLFEGLYATALFLKLMLYAILYCRFLFPKLAAMWFESSSTTDFPQPPFFAFFKFYGAVIPQKKYITNNEVIGFIMFDNTAIDFCILLLIQYI
jgi:hypothetical protein